MGSNCKLNYELVEKNEMQIKSNENILKRETSNLDSTYVLS
jgi:hypothetical protein